MTIFGAGPRLTIIDGNHIDRVFNHHAGNLRLVGLTIRNGNTGASGGGILSNVASPAELSLADCVVTDNTASIAGGLAVLGQLSLLTLDHCIFSDNQGVVLAGAVGVSVGTNIITNINSSLFTNNMTSNFGGAIHHSTGNGTLQVDRCLFAGNQATSTLSSHGGGALSVIANGTTLISHSSFENNSTGASGGAIQCVQNFNTLGNVFTLNHCSITGNSAGRDGGGIFNTDGGGPGLTTIRNTTLSGNRADSDGGGLYIDNVFVADLDFVTLTQNIADNDNDSNGGGGGISLGFASAFNIQNSIVQGNIDKSTPANDDCSNISTGNFTSLGGNVFGLNTGCPVTGSDTTNAALLGPLQANGGPLIPGSLPWARFKPVYMPTHALLPGSSAIDFATCGNINVDQRIHARADGSCDAGAFEVPLALIVTTANDVVDSDPNHLLDLVTNPGADGRISLREAINAANITPGADTITFDPNINGVPIVLDIGSTDEGFNVDGDLDLDDLDGIVIIGNGQNNTIIDGNHTERVFDQDDGDLTLSDLTIRNGQDTSSGGGIKSDDGDLVMNRCTVTDCISDSTSGGIFQSESDGVAFINDSVIQNNQASDKGGGLYISGSDSSLFMDNCTVSGNNAGFGGGGLSLLSSTSFFEMTNCVITGNTDVANIDESGGGGIEMGSRRGFLTIAHSQISGNQTNSLGGGIGINRDARLSLVAVLNTTISGNRADDNGGGIAVHGDFGVINLNFVTMTHNSGDDNTDGTGDGGGLSINASSAIVNIRNSIVQGNDDKTASQTVTDDCANPGGGTFNTLGGNVFDPNTGCPVGVNDTTGSANLGPLQDNGGNSLTHALLTGSAAIDFAVCGDITIDQIGQERCDGLCDSGAFEFSPDADGDTVADNCDFCPGDDRADLNDDGVMDLLDFSLLEMDFGCTSGCSADINNDGKTDFTDFTLLAGAWLCQLN